MRRGFIVFAAAFGLAAGPVRGGAEAAEPAAASPTQVALHKLQQDAAVAEILGGLQHGAPAGVVILRDVQVVDPLAESVASKQSVIVSNGKIAWVGGVGEEPKLPDARVIEGSGRFVAPGLTDMHVHASAADGWLLDLAAGVTAVRDMAGFPWMLEARERINARRMLAPALSVAGPLINGYAMEGYSVVPASPADARRIVRQEAACGYDFIKVHNIVPGPIFDAVNEQAKALGIDVVGHVPHHVTVRHAVESGMRTMEHLKGFIDDATLKPGETDFPAAAGKDVWNTPTLYAGRGYARGEEARKLLSAPEMRYAPLRKRVAWSRALDQPEGRGDALGREAQPIMKTIVGELHRAHAQFLAGTDADNYPFQVMGFALVEEMRLLQEAGLSPAEAMRAATSEPARALKEPLEFGQIQKGMRADLVILDTNPLRDAAAYRANRGVMAHGFWLSREDLDAALAKLEKIEAEPDAAVDASRPAVSALVSRVKALAAGGFVFSAPRLTALADLVRVDGANDAVDELKALARIRNDGPCADYRPR